MNAKNRLLKLMPLQVTSRCCRTITKYLWINSRKNSDRMRKKTLMPVLSISKSSSARLKLKKQSQIWTKCAVKLICLKMNTGSYRIIKRHFKNIRIFWWIRIKRWRISWNTSFKLMNRCEPPWIGKIESKRCRPEIRRSKTRASTNIGKLKIIS